MLYSTFQQIWKPQHCHMELQNVSLHSNPKEWQSKECSNYCTIVLISNASTFMLKILQTRLQQCVNWESADVQTGFRKGRVIRDQIANIHWVMENIRELRKTSTSVTLTTLNPTTLWITTNCGKFLKRWEYQTTSSVSWETCMQVKKLQIKPGMEQLIGSKLAKSMTRL